VDSNLAIVIVMVVAISAALILIVLNTWIRARHGIPTDEELALIAARGNGEAERNVPQLIEQNQRLTDVVARLEQRIAVLERIATDPAERTAREIEKLREQL
jgi:hypothetical protein